MTGCEVDEVYADRRRAGLPRLREVRRRRHGRGHPAPGRRPVHRADRRPPRPARLRHPGRDLRLRRTAWRVGLGPQTPLRSVEPGVPPPAGPGVERLPRAVRVGLCCRIRGIRRGRPRRGPVTVHRRRWSSRPSASPKRPIARSTNTDPCGSRRSPAEGVRPDSVGRTKGGAHGGQDGRGSQSKRSSDPPSGWDDIGTVADAAGTNGGERTA